MKNSRSDSKTAMTQHAKSYHGSGERVLMECRIGDTELLKVLIRPYKSLTLIDVRRFYTDLNGDLRPGKGISLTRTSAALVQKALTKALKLLEEEHV